jgi:hypothetical protein
MEADLVAHCGTTMEGSFVHTLVLTDVASTWTECVALVVRDSTLVVEAIDRLRETMPFPLRSPHRRKPRNSRSMKRGRPTPSVRAAAAARNVSRCSSTTPCGTVSAAARGT